MKTMALLPLCAVMACTQPIELGRPAPPPERLVCKELPVTPDLSPLESVSMTDGVVYYRKADVDDRDGSIARYIVELRGAHFDCRSQLQWNADYYSDS